LRILKEAMAAQTVSVNELLSENVVNSWDIRVPLSNGSRKPLLMNALRVLTLLGVDLCFLLFSMIFVGIADKLAVPYLQSPLEIHPVWLGLFMVAIISIGSGYNSGGDRRQYLVVAWSVLLASLVANVTLYQILSTFNPTSALGLISLEFWPWMLRVFSVCLGRYLVDTAVCQLRVKGVGCYSVVLIAEDKNMLAMKSLIEKEERYRLVKTYSSDALDRANRSSFLDTITSQRVDEIFVDWLSVERRSFVLHNLKASRAVVRLLDLGSSLAIQRLSLLSMDSLTSYTFSLDHELISQFRIKRFFDVIVSILLLLVLSPLFLLVSAAIKIDSPGPIFYRQTRIGLKGREFFVWKFRSMRSDADRIQSFLEKDNETTDGILFKMKNDPRVTRVGRFIRRYSIDELPQLFNVLLSQMSLVGPRPLPVRDVQRFNEASFLIRHEVLPGITGLWQVSGRSDIMNFDQAFELDMRYIENWSLSLDLRILLKTLVVVVRKQGAY
jgi:exopolysaccharide biosynthesis polyprenyl glycosylphosphotransferase